MKILKAIYSFLKKQVGNRPSDMLNIELGRWLDDRQNNTK